MLLELAILAGYALLFIYMLVTGQLLNFLHPRMFPFVLFAAVAFLLLALFLIRSLGRVQRRFSLTPAVIFALPLVMACVIPAGAVSNSTLTFSANKLIGLPSVAAVQKASSNSSKSGAATSSKPLHLKPGQTAVTVTSPLGSKVTEILTDDTIRMDDKNIVLWTNELNNSPKQYAGKKIEYTGYVFKSEQGFQQDEFVAGRDMMWCCAADIEMVGVLCRYSKTPQLRENSWVSVSGTLSTTTYQNETVPIILNPSVKPAAKPSSQYVYPNF